MRKYLAGASKEGLTVGSAVFQEVADEYVRRRKQFKRVKLRWRVSRGARRSLDWVPFKASAIRYKNVQVNLAGVPLSLWDSYGLADYELGAGTLSEDARGRWHLNVCVKVAEPAGTPVAALKVDAVGIDLGLKEFLATSEGELVEAQRFYRDLEPRLAVTQRAGRTPMAKSVLDSGWSAFWTMLQYKCDDAGVWLSEIDEKFSTQECGACGARAGPQGREGLAVRAWGCSCCGTQH